MKMQLKMSPKLTIFVALVLLTVSPLAVYCAPEKQSAEKQKRIAVLPFSFHNPTDDVGDIDVGAEIAKVLSAKIAKMPGWSSVDQGEVWDLLQRDDSADLSGTEIGERLKADAI